MSRLIVRLKAIKYKDDFSYFLSSEAIIQMVLFSHMLLSCTISFYLFNNILSFFISLSFLRGFTKKIMPPNLAITLILYILPKFQL